MNTSVSVIIPCYNCAEFISQAIDSVLIQNVHWELIIVDDGSTDGSKAIIQTFVNQDSRIKYLALDKNSGASKARNAGIQKAKNRYIAFLDSDDYWLPNKLAKQLESMQSQNLSLSYSSYQFVDKAGQYLGEFITKPFVNYHDLLKTCCINCSTVVCDRQRLTKLYFPNIDHHEDYALWLSILKTTQTVAGILEPLAVYRMHKGSISSNKIYAAIYQWRVYRDFLQLNRVKSLYYFCHYGYYGFFKHR